MEENGTKDPITLLTTVFHRRERMTHHHHQKKKKKKKSEMGKAGGYESLASVRRVRRRTTQTKRIDHDVKVLNKEASSGGEEEKDDDEEAELERKIMALQRIVPGGDSLVGIDKLFEETAGYILALQAQVNAMRLLATFFDALEKEKRKLGG